MLRHLVALILLLSLPGCQSSETRSLLGRPLKAPELPEDVRLQREYALVQARTIHAVHPEDEDAIIWLGRRTAYLGHYQEAVEIYTEGLILLPDSYRLLRHRGHRHITLRRLDAAIEDLEMADQLSMNEPDTVEQDGMPNAEGKPRSTTKGNILYHLGLARYLNGEFCMASMDFNRCLSLATNDDMRVAAAYWLFLSARRCGNDTLSEEALSAASPEMDLLENHSYHSLLLSFQDIDAEEMIASHLDEGVEDATLGYGKAMKLYFDGQDDAFQMELERIIEETNWAAFGHLAAEAELARQQESH